MKFNENLEKFRKDALFSQEELANALGIDKAVVSSWENGEQMPDADEVQQIAKTLNVSTETLLEEGKNVINESKDNEKKRETRANVIISILIITLIVAIVGTVYSISQKWNEESSKLKKFVTSISGKKENNFVGMMNRTHEEYVSEYDKRTFNSKYEMETGVTNKFFVKEIINEVIKDNEQGVRKVIVNYNNITAETSEELSKLITSLNKKEYLITYDYSAEGYICQVNIKDV